MKMTWTMYSICHRLTAWVPCDLLSAHTPSLIPQEFLFSFLWLQILPMHCIDLL